MPSTSRRALFGTVAGGVGALAGCAAGQGPRCHGDAGKPPDWRFFPGVRAIERRGNRFRVTVGVGTSDYAESTHHGTRVVLYDAVGDVITSVRFGTISSFESPTKTVEVESFPMVLVGEADSADADAECTYPRTGSAAMGYVGHWPTGTPDWHYRGGSGHVWMRLGEVLVGNRLPERGRPFDRVRCRHRAIVANGNRDHLWLLTGTDAAVPSPFPGAVTTMRYRFLAPRPDPGNGRVEPDGWKSVPARRVPAPVEELTESAGRELTVDAKTFVEYLDALEGPEVDAAAGLPSCSEVHVSCRDTRRPGCRYGGRFTGTEGRYFAYDILSERVYAAHERVWEPPSDIDGRQRRSTGGGP